MRFRAFLLTLAVLFLIGLALLFFIYLPEALNEALYPAARGLDTIHAPQSS